MLQWNKDGRAVDIKSRIQIVLDELGKDEEIDSELTKNKEKLVARNLEVLIAEWEEEAAALNLHRMR